MGNNINGFYYAGEVITDMLNEGYELVSIVINGKRYDGNFIKSIDFLSYVYIEFEYGTMMFVPYEKIDFIKLREMTE